MTAPAPPVFAVVATVERTGACWVYTTETRRPGETSDHSAATRARASADAMQSRSHAEQWGHRYTVTKYVPWVPA